MIVCELLFASDMVLKFFLSYTDVNSLKQVKDLNLIVVNYLQNGFISDLIPLIPL